jgi:hypothetical protein
MAKVVSSEAPKAKEAAPRGGSRLYLSLAGSSPPYALLEWPPSAPLPRVGSRVSVRVLAPRMGMGALWPGLRGAFASDEVRGLRVVSVEGGAAREYSNVLHSGAPPKDARAVRLEVPPECLRRAPRREAQVQGGGGTWAAASRKKKRAGGSAGGGAEARVARSVPLPEVARGPVAILGLGPAGAAHGGSGGAVPWGVWAGVGVGGAALLAAIAAAWARSRRVAAAAGPEFVGAAGGPSGPERAAPEAEPEPKAAV